MHLRLIIGILGCLGFTQSLFAEEPLPRVLILGDKVYEEPARDVGKELKGRVEIVYTNPQPGEVHSTTWALENLDRILGDKPWGLIHFNLGLGDLVYRAPNMKAIRIMPPQAGGVRTTTPETYEANLRQIVKRLKATNASLVWASTTPIRHSSTNVFQLGSEVQYNAIAARVMKEHSIPIHDMYGHVKGVINMDKPASHGADPFFFDRKPIHTPLVQLIRDKLELE